MTSYSQTDDVVSVSGWSRQRCHDGHDRWFLRNEPTINPDILRHTFPGCVCKMYTSTCRIFPSLVPGCLGGEAVSRERTLAPHNGRKNPKYHKQTSSLPCWPVLPSDPSPLSSSSGAAPSSLSPVCPHSHSSPSPGNTATEVWGERGRDRQTER